MQRSQAPVRMLRSMPRRSTAPGPPALSRSTGCPRPVNASESAVDAARAQGLLYEELLVRRARAALREPGAEAEEELREIDRLAQLLELT